MPSRRSVSWPATAVVAVAAAAVAGAISFGVATKLTGDPGEGSAEGLAAEERGTPPAFQAAILADGVVTLEEHKSAVYAAAACLAERGFTVVPRDQGDGYWTWAFRSESSSEVARYQAADKECRDAYSGQVNAVYLAALAATKAAGPSKVDQARAEIARCLAGRGVQGVPEDAPIRRMLDLVENAGKPGEVFNECREIARQKYGVVPAQ